MLVFKTRAINHSTNSPLKILHHWLRIFSSKFRKKKNPQEFKLVNLIVQGKVKSIEVSEKTRIWYLRLWWLMDIDHWWLLEFLVNSSKKNITLFSHYLRLIRWTHQAFKNFRTYRFSFLININEIICAIIVSLVKHIHVKQQEPTISFPWRSSNGGWYYSEREIPLCSSLDVFYRMRSILFWNLGFIRIYRFQWGNRTIPFLE